LTKHWQIGIALFILALALVFGIGAIRLPSEPGYAGIGSRFVPTAVAVCLAVAGLLLLSQALRGGFRNFVNTTAVLTADYRAVLWVSAGVLSMASLIERAGFVVGAAVLFVCTARGFGSQRFFRDAMIGIALVLPVYWLFGQVLDVSLPKLFNRWI
jgi:putative tricarboxylic transport membrane protein